MDESANDFPQFPPPDLCIGINCTFDGEINFHSLRVEGKFQGTLSCTKGFIYVTSSGTIIGDITECKLVIIEMVMNVYQMVFGFYLEIYNIY